LNATIRPDILFPAYAMGFNLIESFYVAMPALSWQTVVVGDVLCAPFGSKPLQTTDLASPIDPETELPALFSQRRLEMLTKSGMKPDAAKLVAKSESREAKKDRAGTRQALEQATKIDPAYVPALLALALNYDSTEEWDLANERYQQVIARNPNHVIALNNLAYSLAIRKGDPAAALPLADRAYRTSISDPLMGDTLAWIYHLLGRDPLAEPIIVIAARQRPDIAEIRLHAALILGATGKTTLAAQHLDAAIRLDPSFDARPDVKELRTRLKPSK
jgi:tetratricopeptide (TPR) repeat protein